MSSVDDATPSPAPIPDSTTRVRRKRSTRNLALRAGSALAVLALSYYCLWRDITRGSGWAWAALVAVLSLLCLREFYRMAEAAGVRTFPVLGYALGPLFILGTEWDLSGSGAQLLPGVRAAYIVLILIGVCPLLLQLTRRTNDKAIENVAVTVFGAVYCSVLPSLCVHLRHLRLDPWGWPTHGVEFAVVCIFVAKVSDVGALLTGSRWGRTKLIPRLSPGKTWEGAVGGLTFSLLLLQFMTWAEPRMALAGLGRPLLLLLSFLLAAGGLAGDLIESSFKRDSRLKDAGSGVPGFGGVLDLTDSLMIAAPVMYFFLLACGAEYVQ